MDRFRVSGGGSDLLRPEANARRTLAGRLMVAQAVNLHTRHERLDGTKTEWKPAVNRGEALDRFDRFAAAFAADRVGDRFVVAHEKKDGSKVVLAAVNGEDVKILALTGCSPATSQCWSLVKHQFPDVIFAGGLVSKQISGTTDWSDHAWGTAFDSTQGAKTTNDEQFEWLVRMARAGCTDFDYLLGSRAGRVVESYAPDFDIESSGAASSHLWHIHASVVNHHGARPPA